MPHDNTSRGAHDDERYTFTINGARHQTRDPKLSGRELLLMAGFNPPSEHVLVLITAPGSRAVGLDERLDLREPGREDLRAFLSDRVFTFTIDEAGCVWGAPKISEADLRAIAGAPAGKALVVERKDEPDTVLEDGDDLDLTARGAEQVKTRKRVIVVTYGDDEKEFTFEPGEYTGAELATRFGVPAGYVLDLIINGDFHEIAPDKRLRLKNGMHFVSQPGKGASS